MLCVLYRNAADREEVAKMTAECAAKVSQFVWSKLGVESDLY